MISCVEFPAGASAVTLSGGDLVYAEPGGWWGVAHPGGVNEIVRMSDGLFPQDAHVTPDGVVYLVGSLGYAAGGSIIRLREGAAPQVLSTGGSFASPAAVTVSPGGRIFVADQDAFGLVGAVFEIDRTTGAQREVMRGMQPRGVAALDDSTLAVGSAAGGLTYSLVLIRADDGSLRSGFSQPGFRPDRLAIGPDGTLWASGFENLYRVSIAPTLSIENIGIPYPYASVKGLGVDIDGSPLLCGTKQSGGSGWNGFIVRYDRSDSQLHLLASGSYMASVLGVGRMPAGVTPAATTTWGAVKGRYR